MVLRLLLAAFLLLVLTPGPPPTHTGASGSSSQNALAGTVFLPMVSQGSAYAGRSHALLTAIMPDGLAPADVDEAFAIQNVGGRSLNLEGWRIDDGEGAVTLPPLMLPPGGTAWCSRQAAEFRRFWGANPACEYETDTDPTVPDATGRIPRLANDGDELLLIDPHGAVVDAVVYENGSVPPKGWTGPTVGFFQGNPRFSHEGQVFYRLFDPATGLSLPDTNTAGDWAQGNSDPARGRRAAYPGWDLRRYIVPFRHTYAAPPAAIVAVTPDNAYPVLRDLFASATSSVHVEAYDFEHPELAQVLVEAAARGVDVQLLLEGNPAFGLTDATRWAASAIAGAGGDVRYMINDGKTAYDRYAYVHVKAAVVDNETVVVSTENFSRDSFTLDAWDGSTRGRRGYAVAITDPVMAAHVEALFGADASPSFGDIRPWQSGDPDYGPPAGYSPPPPLPREGYTVRHPAPIHPGDIRQAAVFTAPEASLTPGPLLDLINRAGAGDAILVQQLFEEPFWGASGATATTDPNPRLEALIAAARRGARVRILLDSFFDDPTDVRSNAATIAYVNDIARHGQIDLAARHTNPAGAGLHAKLHLITAGDERWIVLGSINGGEVSAKLNRELAIAFESPSSYAYLEGVFQADWESSQP